MSKPKQPMPLYLGIECGGTRSSAVLTKNNGSEAVQFQSGPANLRLLSDQQLVQHFRSISAIAENASPTAISIGMAGARTEADRQRIRNAAGKVWPQAQCYATNDLETALAAAKSPNGKELPRVLVLSGTGSCCFGQTLDGKTAKVGGWGHILGDKASGYEIGLRALKAVVFYYDRDGIWPKLGHQILRFLQLNQPNDLISWVQSANKTEIAALAVEVFKAWSNKDKIATDIVVAAGESLATDAAACAARLVKRGTPVQFVLSGSVLLKQPMFAKDVARRVTKLWPKAVVTPLERESVWGAVELAKKHFGNGATEDSKSLTKTEILLPKAPALSPELPATERRNPLSLNLDQLSIEEMVELMLREDEKIPGAILAEKEKISRAVRLITSAFRKGGRLFYFGAGTSGRLGVLDASECPPTFRTPPEMVQGIIAGGQAALWRAAEGAEDDLLAGKEAVQFKEVSKNDVVIGIAASGKTPFVWGALLEAKKRGATTILICFNPQLKVAAKDRPNILIAPDVGPEVLTGSTRLKAGTATKLILNMLTTLAMVKMGKVISNLMVDLNPSNIKLRDRAVRIVREITGTDADTAKKALEKSKWNVKETCLQLRKSNRPASRNAARLAPNSSTRAVAN